MSAWQAWSILRRQNLVTMARLVAALTLAGLATHSLRSRQYTVDGLIYLLGAAGLFLWEMHREQVEGTWPALAEESPLRQRQWIAIGLAFFLGLLSWPLFSNNRLNPIGLILLAGALALVALACRQRASGRTVASTGDLLSPRVRWMALLGVVLLAAVFRLYQLDTLPGDMFNDLAHNYGETQRILDGQWMIYATGYPGREPLLFYLTALLAQVSGLNFLTLKLITALLGIATVPVVYLLGREAYNDAVGLVAALFLAVAKWHVLINRVGFRGTLAPLVVALVLYFLLRGLKRGRRGDFLWAGAWTGLAWYTYTAALAVVPAVLLGLGLYVLAGRAGDLWRMRRSLLLALLVALLVALPMLRFMLLDGRDVFWFRPLTRVSSIETTVPGPVGLILLQNVVTTAGMFHVRGDVVFRTNIPDDPHLGILSGALLLLGLPLVLARWRRGSNALVVMFFLVLLLPTALALAFPHEVPGAVRAAGALATVMLFPALAVVATWRRLGQLLPPLGSKWGWAGLFLALALGSGLYNARLCFVEYPKFLPAGNYPLFREIAHVVDEFGSDGPVFLKSVPHWDDKDAIRVQTSGHKMWGLAGEILTEIDPVFFAGLTVAQGAVIVNPQQDMESLYALREIYPQGVTVFYRDPQGLPQFAVFLFRQGEQGP